MHIIKNARIPLHTKILIGFILGAVLGALAHLWWKDQALLTGVLEYVTQPIGQIFLRLLFMLVIPLLFSALVLGVAELGDIRALGRVGWKTLLYTIIVSSIAVVIGIVLVNLVQPGVGLDDVTMQSLKQSYNDKALTITTNHQSATNGLQLLIQIVPDNIIKAMANSDMLAVMFFALMIGIALVTTPTPATNHVKLFVQGVYDLSMRLIDYVIQLAPYAVACLLFSLTAQLGLGIFLQLGKYVFVAVLAMLIHQFITYSLILRWFGNMSPKRFFKAVEPAMLTAFSTASSSATLPTALMVAEENLRLPTKISRFVLTVGATANQNGTALFEGITVLFLAQVWGVDLTLAQQLLVMGICILGGIGTAGVPAGSLPVIVMILGMVNVPPEAIALILGVDRFLDMCRTTLNVTGDLVAAVVVSQGQDDNIN